MNAKSIDPCAASLWRRLSRLALAAMLITAAGFSHAGNVFVEEMTWIEVRDAIFHGTTTAIIYVGSTEQNGPHMVLGKHNFIAREVAGRIAQELGDALVYPVLPYALTGEVSRRSAHMRFPGTVTLRPSTLQAAVRDVAESALTAGFRYVFLAGDHGGGQLQLAAEAVRLDRVWRARGRRVYHLSDTYYVQNKRFAEALVMRGVVPGGHAALADTSELMSIDARGSWVRSNLIGENDGKTESATGVDGNVRGANAALGELGLRLKVELGVAQIRRLRTHVPHR